MVQKDVYEIFNEIEFNVDTIEEVPVNEVEKQRIKNLLKKKLEEKQKNENVDIKKSEDKNLKGTKKIYRAVSIAVIALIVLGFSPVGKDVLAAIKEKLIFNPSYGVIDGNKWGDIYILKEPKRINIGEDSILIKSIINNGDYISMELWITENNSEENTIVGKKINEVEKNLKIKTNEGEILSVESSFSASGGYYGVNFKENEKLISEFDLYYVEEKIDSFVLEKVDYVDNYDEIGGNSKSKEVLIGGTSYYEEGERYFKIWSNLDHSKFENYRMELSHIDSIKVTDNEGNPIEIENANDSSGKAYKILSEYEGQLKVVINDVDLTYELKSGGKINLKMPKEGETIKVEKEVKLSGLEDRIFIENIKNIDGEYSIAIDYSNNYDEDRIVYMVSQGFRSGGGMGDPENQQGEMYLDKNDLSLKEKMFKKISLNLDRISVKQKGNWNFIME